nr:hypothetical protein [uncultured bacterium]
MKVPQFLAHHGIFENPFGQEDAQTDHVFTQHCLTGTHHPAWDKIFGDPAHPSTSVVFGEKGSGKTALRLQISRQLEQHNREMPGERVFIIEYDDFNPFLDSFRDRLHGRKRKPERALESWRLWDHMDAILSLGVTRVSKAILNHTEDPDGIKPDSLTRLSRQEKRDLLLLAAFYDHSLDRPAKQRWSQLRRRMKYRSWWSHWDTALALVVTAATVGLIFKFGEWRQLYSWWAVAIFIVAWLPLLSRQAILMWTAWRVSRQIHVFDHSPNTLRRILCRIPRQELASQPIPSKDRSDDRYELLQKFQRILKKLGYASIIVLVDRVDEPHLVNGSPERMRDLLWPMFDNKFLKHPGIGFKLLLPAEVVYYLKREEKEFYERSRLDKQNLIPSLEWTGESLFDVANDRIRACVKSADKAPSICDLFDESYTQGELIGIFARLRVPRQLFKFLHRLIVDHCNRYTDEAPRWRISRDTVQATLALYLRDIQAFDQGQGTG